jgi:hypothetical protein
MQLITINKEQYRKRLNLFIGVFVVSLALLAIAYGALLISAFSDGQSSNFKFNFMGVVLALFTCMMIINHRKKQPWFHEIFYVWQLKQLHNAIYRKFTKIKTAADSSNQQALTILLFYYQSLKQVYELDNNTLTIDTVNKKLAEIEQLIDQQTFEIHVEDFDKTLLALF